MTFRYPVRFTRGLLASGNPMLRDVVSGELVRPLRFVVDAGVVDHHSQLLEDIRVSCAIHALELAGEPVVVPGGEQVKQGPAIVDEVRDAIDAGRVCRHSYVVGVGGGAVVDMVRFAAATSHRGVRLVRVPTTVLAQNDSAVGVKNGIKTYGKPELPRLVAPPWAVLAAGPRLAGGQRGGGEGRPGQGRRLLRVDGGVRAPARRARPRGDGVADPSLRAAPPRAHPDERQPVRVATGATIGGASGDCP